MGGARFWAATELTDAGGGGGAHDDVGGVSAHDDGLAGGLRGGDGRRYPGGGSGGGVGTEAAAGRPASAIRVSERERCRNRPLPMRHPTAGPAATTSRSQYVEDPVSSPSIARGRCGAGGTDASSGVKMATHRAGGLGGGHAGAGDGSGHGGHFGGGKGQQRMSGFRSSARGGVPGGAKSRVCGGGAGGGRVAGRRGGRPNPSCVGNMFSRAGGPWGARAPPNATFFLNNSSKAPLGSSSLPLSHETRRKGQCRDLRAP